MDNMQISVLVIGVGGNVSQGILKAIAASDIGCRVIGACIDPLSVGLFTADKGYICPMADDPGFLEWVLKVCRDENIKVIFSGVEEVLNVLSGYSGMIARETGAVCVVSTPSLLAVGQDKLLTCDWLEANGFNYPGYAASEDRDAVLRLIEAYGYPLIGKPRKGKGSRGLIMVRSFSDVEYAASLKDYVIEEYLGDDNSEYTASCFCDKYGKARGAIVMRRKLLHGTTYIAELGLHQEIREEVIRITEALKPAGPCNFQLRVSKGKPVCFEINMRFSGTTPVRAQLGFNDVEAALRHYGLGEPAYDLPVITKGIMLRYWNEIYIDPEAADVLKREGLIDDSINPKFKAEDYGMRRQDK